MSIKYYGWNPPFFGGHQNVMSKQSGDRLIKNDILQLLLTMPGERVMRPNWGTGIKSALFENADDSTVSDLVDSIKSQLVLYEPRVSLDAQIDIDEDNATMTVHLSGVFTNEPNHTFEDELVLKIKRTEM